jgi:heme oxygenase
MLRKDLAALGVDAGNLPSVSSPSELTPIGAGYVVSGSRLGLTMIRRAGYWGSEHALPSAYMEDEFGLAIWKAASAYLKRDDIDLSAAQRDSTAAVAAFETFRAAFTASAPQAVN